MWGDLSKGAMASVSTLSQKKLPPSSRPDSRQCSSSPDMSLVSFKVLSPCWSSVSPSKSMCGPFKRNCLGLQKPSISLTLSPHWFLQPEVLGTSLPGTGTLAEGAWCGTGTPHSSWGTSAAEISLLVFICHMQVWDQPVLYLHPSYQSHLPIWLLI